MKIGIEVNGVLRDTLKKIQQEYEKWYIDNPFKEESEFEYKVISELTSLNIGDHLSFPSDDDIYEFLYKEHTMEIFGHAGSSEMSSINDLNDFYLDNREIHEIIIVSDEIGKSKPATLFFLSKFGCLVESVKFYSEQTIDFMWNSIDILLTANPKLLLNHPTNKIIIKYETVYNRDIISKFEIKKIRDLNEKIKEIYV